MMAGWMCSVPGARLEFDFLERFNVGVKYIYGRFEKAAPANSERDARGPRKNE